MPKLVQLDEPQLLFGHSQSLAHPKDGLTLFGPYQRTAGSVRYGIIGTEKDLAMFRQWSTSVNRFLPAYAGSMFRRKRNAEFGKLAHQFFPGFETAFGITWNPKPECVCVVPDDSLNQALQTHELHTRISRVVKAYTKRLTKANYESEHKPDIWFVIVDKALESLCRPQSEPPRDYAEGTKAEDAAQRSLFTDAQEADSFAEEYHEALKFKPDFHNQLKARLLKHQIITQVLQYETMDACLRTPDNPVRDKEDPATISWNLATSIFYKTRRRPWILADARDGVCYMGVVFKRLTKPQGDKNACCGAQMFLEDGNGMVFKGALGPWYSEDKRECHLDREESRKFLERAIHSYADEHDKKPPREIFVHGSVRFDDEEWAGFSEAAKPFGTKVVGVRIRRVYGGLKLFTRGKSPVMRGAALLASDTKAYLFATGFVPRLNTYPGWNVPNPLEVEICNGDADIMTVLQDILRLSKLNYNSCKFSDGYPITLKFAGRIGDILTTLPPEADEATDDSDAYTPLPFWHYV
ncbi:argonaute/piwi family protein [Bradyrhizobium zhanjiangense]|uniref:argonaute/piwi family protein n=1 Tax=Bradyrhizobium zhanjiangense TaxID=1325107 RepID=UPI0010089918|nr:hypothetical protein [Bradyrhizobium zhanjiangense]